MTKLLADTQTTDSLKKRSSTELKSKILTLRTELRSILLGNFDKYQKCLKMQSYASGNKAGKLLARQIEGAQAKTHIPFLYHPITKQKLSDLQAIANAFSIYYGTLYNLKNDNTLDQIPPLFRHSLTLSTS